MNGKILKKSPNYYFSPNINWLMWKWTTKAMAYFILPRLCLQNLMQKMPNLELIDDWTPNHSLLSNPKP